MPNRARCIDGLDGSSEPSIHWTELQARAEMSIAGPYISGGIRRWGVGLYTGKKT
jgi:hypothetical protein